MAELSTALENLGGYLKENRLAQRVKLEELSARTRISVRFLEAIEENHFGLLPNPVSARGFLRAYARALSLAEEPILRRFLELQDEAHPAAVEEEPSKPLIKSAPPKEPVSAPFKMGIPLGILAVIVLIIWAVSRGGGPAAPPRPQDLRPEREAAHSSSPTPPQNLPPAPEQPPSAPPAAAPPPPPSVPPTAEVPSPAPPRPQTEEPDPLVPPSPAPPPPVAEGPLVKEQSAIPSPDDADSSTSLPPATPAADLLVLEVEALEPSWINVQIDFGGNREVLLQPGQRVRWQARDRFLLTLGNAGGVKVSYNGKPLEPFGPSGKVVKGILLAR